MMSRSLTRRRQPLLLTFLLIALFGFDSSTAIAQQSFPVSVNTSGTQTGNGLSTNARVSGNGRFVVFQSSARDLVATPDTNNTTDIFVRDLQTNQTTLVSQNLNGTAAANGFSGNATISSDGRFIAFGSRATNLIAAPDTNNATDVFVRDMQTGVTTLVSINSANNATGNAQSLSPTISANGRVVVFFSDATDLTAATDSNNEADLFARNLNTSTTTLISVNRSGGTSANGSGLLNALAVSEDGRYIAFASVATDLATDATVTDANGVTDVFVRDTQLNTTKLASIDSSNTVSGNGSSLLASITPDGRYVAFISFASNLVANDANNINDAFVRDLQTNTTILVSVNAAGTMSGNQRSSLQPGATISDNGRYVVFSSLATDLTSDIDNDDSTSDVFVRDLVAGTTKLISTLFSRDFDSPSTSDLNYFGSISGNGRFVSYVYRSTYTAPDGNPYIYENVYVSDLSIGTTSLVSNAIQSPYFGQPNTNTSLYTRFARGSISSDGSTIVYESNAPASRITDNNNFPDIFAYRTNTTAVTGIFINDVRVAEGAEGETQTLDFTVTLSVAVASPVTVDYRTQSFNNSGYFQPVAGTLTFAPGETSKTVSVTAFGNNTFEASNSFFVVLSNASANAVIGKDAGIATLVNDDESPFANAPARVLISEFRTRGTAGAADDFVELYNNSDTAIDVNGWKVVTLDANGNQAAFGRVSSRGVIIRARGYMLLAGRNYSLQSYANANADNILIEDNRGMMLVDNNGLIVDAVGFNQFNDATSSRYREGRGLAVVDTGTAEASFVRRQTSGRPQDTNDNQADFVLVSTSGATFNGIASILGAPAPQNESSPVTRSSLDLIRFNAYDALPTAYKTRLSSPRLVNASKVGVGTFVLRRTFVNTTGGNISRLRFRVVDNGKGNIRGGNLAADARLVSSGDSVQTIGNQSVAVRGITLDEPPLQGLGSGLNSSFNVPLITSSNQLGVGASITLEFRFNVVRGGQFRFSVVPEVLP